MTNFPQGRRTVTLERVVYGLALKTAARLGGAFKSAEIGRQIVVVLRLPVGADFHEYVAAATILVREVEALHAFAIASPNVGNRGGLDPQTIYGDLKRKSSLLVVWPSGHAVPREIALAADRVVEVGALRPFHLVAAAKQFAGQVIDLADAKRMMAHPLPEVFAAFRTGRPASAVLDRLSDVEEEPMSAGSGVRLEDLVGYNDAKTWGLSLSKDIGEWKDGKLAWSDVDRGLLLSGRPGTGKTMFAGALARSCGAHLVATSVARWQAAGRLDDTLKSMRRSFDEAISRKPSILFIDEIDGISDRIRLVGTQHETYWVQVINFLLELIDGHERLEGVVVVGATNHPDVVDAALRRPGRLDRHVRISLPDGEERKHLSRMYFGHHLSESDVETIAAATAGFTGAHFEQAGRQARREARQSGERVDLEMVMRGLPPARRLNSSNRKTVALHEAAHAVVGLHLGVGQLAAVVVPWETRDPQPAGFAQFTYLDVELDRQIHLDRIALLLAGRAAEELFLGTALDGAGGVEGSDLAHATDIATAMEISYGLGESLSFLGATTPNARTRVLRTNPAVARRVERILTRQMDRCREIVRSRRSVIEEVAGLLEKRGHLDGKEVVELLAADAAQGTGR